MKILILGAGKMGSFFLDLLSFDHEFGTWDDPAKCYYPSGVRVEKIRSIKVYDEDDNEIPFEYDRERIEELELYLN